MSKLFVEQLTVIDCSYLHADRGLVGESWIVDVELQGELNEQGMIFDFGDVKRSIKNTIDEYADHKLLVPLLAPELDRLHNEEGYIELEFTDKLGRRLYQRAPAHAVCLLQEKQIDSAALERHISDRIRSVLPANVSAIGVTLRTEVCSDPVYQYSHGLKKHGGNCQRIAHGHRSRIEIWQDGRRSRSWEQYWANKWRDIYIACREDCVAADGDRYRISYTAAQGEFTIELPRSCCYLIDTESTVEQIAAHIAGQLHEAKPRAKFKVRVFEGVNKGAIAEISGACA